MNANADPTVCIFPAKGSTQAATALTAGINTLATIDGDGSGVGSDRQRIPIDKVLVAILRFVASTKNATYNYRLWGGNNLTVALKGPLAPSAILQCIGAGTFVISTSATAIADTGTALDGCYFADQVLFEPSTATSDPKGPVTTRADALQEVTHDAFSPNDSGVTPAELTLSSIGRFGFLVVEFTDQSGKTKFALVSRHRA